MKLTTKRSRQAVAYSTAMFLLYALAGCTPQARDRRSSPLTTQSEASIHETSGGPINETLTNESWKHYDNQDYERAIESARACVNEFGGEASRIQLQLEKDGAEVPPTVNVSASQKAEIFKHGVLNDVAACYYVIGRSSECLGQIDQALSAYAEARKLAYARCWDPKGWFWDPAQSSADRARMLTP